MQCIVLRVSKETGQHMYACNTILTLKYCVCIHAEFTLQMINLKIFMSHDMYHTLTHLSTPPAHRHLTHPLTALSPRPHTSHTYSLLCFPAHQHNSHTHLLHFPPTHTPHTRSLLCPPAHPHLTHPLTALFPRPPTPTHCSAWEGPPETQWRVP